jgi:Oxidoreductase family, NAD-binding Rossmann fold
MRIVKRTPVFLLALLSLQGADLRIGLVGIDAPDAVTVTEMLNDTNSPDYLPGLRIVAAYKNPSAEGNDHSRELASKWRIDLTPDVPALLRKVDAVIITGGDAQTHFEQAKLAIAAGKPFFAEFPLAPGLDEARELAKLATDAGVPWFSASPVRFGEIASNLKFTDTAGVSAWGPGAVEVLFALMGTGCEEVTEVSGGGTEWIAGKWRGGRIGTAYLAPKSTISGAVVFRLTETMQSRARITATYRPLLAEVVRFFDSQQPPVSNTETLEVMSFLDAAARSKAAGGTTVKISGGPR